MLPPSHLLTLVPNRALAAAKRLEAAIWTDARPLECHATEPSPQLVSLRHAPNLPTRKIEPGTRWGKLYDSRWYRLDFPPADDNTWLTLREQSEATLYVAGQPRFGLDVAHRHGRLPEGTTQAWIQSIAIQSAIWHHQRRSWSADGCEFVGVWLVRRDEAAWDGYHDLQCLIDLMLEWRKAQDPATENPPSLIGYQGSIAIAPPEYRRLLRRLDQACDALERRGVSAMRDVLATAYDELRADRSLLRCIATGHAHIDLVWLWPERIGEMKAVHTFANVDALMNDYPEFRFAYSQPASYEAVKRREPELFGRVKNRIDTGRWQATGAMYVESDTMMPCGEALARSFEIGQRAFTDLRGEPSPLVWLPDVFGYSACLPQIMKLNGIKYFFTTKMTWNAINRFPHSSFNWQGHDGSTVLAHVIQDTIGYNGTLHVPQLRATMLTHQQADVHGEYLMPSGYGDGGGGPTRLICERARRLNRMHTMPEIAWDHPEAFFDRLAPLADQLPTHEGECYLEFHRGIFTTHRRLKHAFRSMECALQVAEAISSRTGESIDLEHAWKRAIFSQFHDYIPGSSVWDVYAEGLPELEELAEDLTRGSAKLLAASEGQPCVFNPHAVPVVHLVDDGQASIVLAPLSGSSLDDAHATPQRL